MMKKSRLLIAILGGLIVGLVLPIEWRAKLSQPLAGLIGGMVEHMPDG